MTSVTALPHEAPGASSGKDGKVGSSRSDIGDRVTASQ
jgi:hypothetical protein